MSNRTLQLSPELQNYVIAAGLPETDALAALRRVTGELSHAAMQISPEQGQLMHLLTRLIGATRALEVGVFTGYSSLWVALALPPGGQLVACDKSEKWTDIARQHWELAGVSQRIDLRIGPAMDTLDALLAEPGQKGSFDLAFVDADKENSLSYYERCLELVRTGGLLLFDNALWEGSVVDATNTSPSTLAIRSLAQTLAHDLRVLTCLVPIGDGLLLAHKR